MQRNIIDHIRMFIDLNESDFEVFKKYIEIKQIKKKQSILLEGSVCKWLYFVERGCLKMSFTNKKGVEQITQFALEGWWLTDFKSFINQAPSDYKIQAIEESRIISIEGRNLDSLILELPKLEKYFRRMMQEMIAGAQLRSKLLYEMSKEEFYFHFSTQFPEFMMRVPQYKIASYLGLSPEYLSELRKKNV